MRKSLGGKENKDSGNKPAKEPKTPKTPAQPKKLFQVRKHINLPQKKKLLNLFFQVAPGSVGSLTRTVNYVVKNGQLQFVRRRSPRKKQVNLINSHWEIVVFSIQGGQVDEARISPT